MYNFRTAGFRLFVFFAAVMLGACSISSKNGSQGGQGDSGGGGSPASTGGSTTVTATGGASGTSSQCNANTAAGTVAVCVSDLGTSFNFTQGSYLAGFDFRASHVITITQLGFYDSNLSAPAANAAQTFVPTPVGIYDLSTHTLLGSATVQASDPATGFYRYASLPHAILLNTTDTYSVVGVTGTNNYDAGGTGRIGGGFGGSGATMNPAVTLLSEACLGVDDQCLTQTTTLVEPNAVASWINLGPNFAFETPPAIDAGTDAGTDTATAADTGAVAATDASAGAGTDADAGAVAATDVGTDAASATADAPVVKDTAGSSCPGEIACGGVCVDLQTDRNNCGACGKACGETTPFCASGSCSANPPSCAAGMTCGAAAESCCTSPEVTGGTFYRTYTNDGSGPTGEADPATVSSFRLDKYDVTVGRFRQFVGAWNAGWRPAAGSGKHAHLNGGLGLANSGANSGVPGTYEPGWIASDSNNVAPTNANLGCSSPRVYATWTSVAGTQENLPMNCTNWYEAYAFCIWDGGFLPTDAEWRYAAAGGAEQREYPWGSTDPGTGNQYAIYGGKSIAPVGSATLGAGLWGQLDLAGNIGQWNLDGCTFGYADPCTDCFSPTTTTGALAALCRETGGTYSGDSAKSDLLSAARVNSGAEWSRYAYFGFRCARTP